MLRKWVAVFGFWEESQGSTEAVTDSSAAVTERSSYDAWGRRRDVADWDGYETTVGSTAGYTYGSKEKPGYTGHEDLDCAGLIHMNGRICDPEIGRFLQVDPVIQDPGSSQNYNPYAYVINNPMNLTDPSGNSWLSKVLGGAGKLFGKVFKSIGRTFRAHFNVHRRGYNWVKRNYKAVVTVIVSAVIIYATWGAGSGWVGVLIKGAAIGAGVSASTTAIMGGSWRDIGKAAFTGAVTGAIAAGVAGSLLHGIQAAANLGVESSKFAWNVAHGLAHGLTGGAMSAAQGGSFADGFIGAAVGAFLTPTIGDKLNLGAAGSGGWQMIAARTAVAATIGGTASALSGGKFATGALTAGFLHLFNAEGTGQKIATKTSNLLSGLRDWFIGENGGRAWITNPQTTIQTAKWLVSRDLGALGAEGFDPQINDNKYGHSMQAYYLQKQFGLLGTPLIAAGGVAYELYHIFSPGHVQGASYAYTRSAPYFGAFDGQHPINWLWDTPGDLIGNTIGQSSALLGVNGKSINRITLNIPGPDYSAARQQRLGASDDNFWTKLAPPGYPQKNN